MIDYTGFADRLAACPDRAARWDLLRDVQREWGFVGAGNVWTPRTEPVTETFEDLYDEFEGFDEADDDHGYAAVVPAAVNEYFAMAENSFRQAPRLYWTHPMDRPCRWPTARDVFRLRKHGIAEASIPPFHGEFMSEYEACFSWGYRESEAAADDDPPVYVLNSSRLTGELIEDLAEGPDDPENQLRVARSVTEWALAFVLTRLPFSSQYLLGKLEDEPNAVDPSLFDHAAVARHRVKDIGALTERQRSVLESSFPELGLLFWHDAGGGRLRGGRDVILRQWKDGDLFGSDYELSIAARTPEAMDAALATIGLEE
ncbi:hypothetical protein [Catenulispora subtropica]|uniref:Uncharacterized protein n=1 Tax=Catenulispora subtropica TaxID=450798 RepID=A0ABP5E3C1_9ACTN